MNVTFRPALPSEAEVLSRLAQAGKSHWGYPKPWLEAWRELLTITPEYVSAQVVCCAVDESSEVVGFYALETGSGCCRLEHLWLNPSRIGQRLGRRIFEHAVQSAREMGAAELFIDADPNAEGFYLHMGAKRVGETVSRLTGVERVLPRLQYTLSSFKEQWHA
jgi:GNAT superfamily N-acetyltransferase